MKRVNNIYNKICDIDVIMDMYDKVIKTNTKNKKKIQNFENYYSCNIAKIKETLITKSYVPEKYNIFLNDIKNRQIRNYNSNEFLKVKVILSKNNYDLLKNNYEKFENKN